MSSIRVLIAASGSGGHLFPALYIAKAISQRSPTAEIHFIGSGRPLEERIIDGAGFKRHVISVSGVQQGGLKSLITFLLKSPKALLAIRKLYRSFKPQVVVGVGGYVSVLPVIYARLAGIPTWIHEGELKPGLANWLLSFFTSKISTSFMEATVPSLARKKAVFTGHPLRSELVALARKTPSADRLPKHLLVIGGSQGARGLDQTVPKLAPVLIQNGISVRHQSRKENVEAVQTDYDQSGVKAQVVNFIDDMAEAFDWADIIISRSGAGSVLEISVSAKPAIFVPYPHQQGTHQTENAMTLVNAGKALVVEEGDDFQTRLSSALESVLKSETYQKMLLTQYSGRAIDGAERIAEGVLGLVKETVSLSV